MWIAVRMMKSCGIVWIAVRMQDVELCGLRFGGRMWNCVDCGSDDEIMWNCVDYGSEAGCAIVWIAVRMMKSCGIVLIKVRMKKSCGIVWIANLRFGCRMWNCVDCGSDDEIMWNCMDCGSDEEIMWNCLDCEFVVRMKKSCGMCGLRFG